MLDEILPSAQSLGFVRNRAFLTILTNCCLGCGELLGLVMDKKVKNRENQERFAQAQKELGLKRLMLWVRPEDADTLKLAAKQPHSLAALRKKIEAELERELRPIVKKKVEAKLRRRTERALLVQKRSQARKRLSGSNRPPECIRFNRIPPAALRGRLKASGWLYDPVAVIWHLPNDPSLYEASEALLRDLEAYDIEKLDRPDPDEEA